MKKLLGILFAGLLLGASFILLRPQSVSAQFTSESACKASGCSKCVRGDRGIEWFCVGTAGFDSKAACLASGCKNCLPYGDDPGYFCDDKSTVPAPGRTSGTAPFEGVDFGNVTLPAGLQRLGTGASALVTLLNIILRLLVVVGGIWALINIIIAGYQFMTAGGDPKAISSAWARIWQSLLGLTIIAASFLLAAIISQLLFGSPTAILSPEIFVPK